MTKEKDKREIKVKGENKCEKEKSQKGCARSTFWFIAGGEKQIIFTRGVGGA
jgi:hypothetical protein